ncbi:MAG: IS200/IS605 family accessory protein TnpB-related protein [Candidatus Desulfofervidus sp.]|nr:IS200/IS605 family accessory protein TnpB-related protein [Candidatus Desulfofervidus sp.]
MAKVTIPGFICEIKDEDKAELEKVMNKFGKARRRAYSMKWKGMWKSVIEKQLQEEIGLNSRYIKDAYHSIKDLPPHVTFGGLKNQRLRERGKISKEEYKKRRNSILISRGDKSRKGNVNLRLDLDRMELRINTGSNRKWIYPKIFIPEKYLNKYRHLLDGTRPYTILIKRRDNDRGFDVRISVDAPLSLKESSRIMTLDMNVGHIDFCIMDKKTKEILAVGKINHHETQFVKRNKRENLVHKVVDKIGNIAEHYNAEVVVGKLNTGKFKSKNRRLNRKIKNLSQFKFRQILKKLEKRGIKVRERSEAYTTKIGKKLSPLIGLDVHKCSAIAFCIKLINYKLFELMRTNPSAVFPNEGNGSLRERRRMGCELTAPVQSLGLGGDEASDGGGYPAILGSGGLSFMDNLKTGFACLHVEVC